MNLLDLSKSLKFFNNPMKSLETRRSAGRLSLIFNTVNADNKIPKRPKKINIPNQGVKEMMTLPASGAINGARLKMTVKSEKNFVSAIPPYKSRTIAREFYNSFLHFTNIKFIEGLFFMFLFGSSISENSTSPYFPNSCFMDSES